MAKKPLKTAVAVPCECGHYAEAHVFARKAAGCTMCNCISYGAAPRYSWKPAPSAEERAHWSHHVGLPAGETQMTAAECGKAYDRGVYQGRRAVLRAAITKLEHSANWERETYRQTRVSYKKTMRESRAELDRKYSELAAIPDVSEPKLEQKEAA